MEQLYQHMREMATSMPGGHHRSDGAINGMDLEGKPFGPVEA